MNCLTNCGNFLVSSRAWLKLAMLVIFSCGILRAQSGESPSGSTKEPTEFQVMFDREWRKTNVDIDYLKTLASNYSFNASDIRVRVMAYLDKAKGYATAPPFSLTTTGYVPETTAYTYLDEAKDWPGMCARLRVVLAVCDAELVSDERRAKWQFIAGCLMEYGDAAADTPKIRRNMARRIVLYICDMLNTGNHATDKQFAAHSSSWLTHLVRRGWLSELLAALEPPTERFSSDTVLSLANKAAQEAQALGGQANTECAIQLLKVLAPRFIRPGEGHDWDDVHYNVAVIYLSTGRYDLARAEAAMLRTDGNLAPCRKYFDKWIADAKAKQEATEKAKKKKATNSGDKPKPRP